MGEPIVTGRSRRATSDKPLVQTHTRYPVPVTRYPLPDPHTPASNHDLGPLGEPRAGVGRGWVCDGSIDPGDTSRHLARRRGNETASAKREISKAIATHTSIRVRPGAPTRDCAQRTRHLSAPHIPIARFARPRDLLTYYGRCATCRSGWNTSMCSAVTAPLVAACSSRSIPPRPTASSLRSVNSVAVTQVSVWPTRS
jgi:hypothetical protein